CGTSVPKANAVSFVTGTHRYVSDMKLPNMMYGKVLRPPSYGAKLKSVDLSRARTVPDVVAVHDGDFVAVCRPNPIAAERALTLEQAEKEHKPQPSRDVIFDYLVTSAKAPGGGVGGSYMTDRLARASVESD